MEWANLVIKGGFPHNPHLPSPEPQPARKTIKLVVVDVNSAVFNTL